ncbi:MAG: hypothetical protein IT211_00650 [Armatimonadetes bacterium]|nr:hypothetical protein [Armatimonadota bacterium]
MVRVINSSAYPPPFSMVISGVTGLQLLPSWWLWIGAADIRNVRESEYAPVGTFTSIPSSESPGAFTTTIPPDDDTELVATARLSPAIMVLETASTGLLPQEIIVIPKSSITGSNRQENNVRLIKTSHSEQFQCSGCCGKVNAKVR